MSATRAPTRRGLGVGAAIVGALVLVALLAGRPPTDGPPLDPRSDGPLGTSALVELLRRLDAEVDLSVGMPGPDDDVALLLEDQLTDDQRDEISRWVRSGGRLVVAQPGPLTPRPTGQGVFELGVDVVEPQRCTVSALSGLGEIDALEAALLEVPPGAASCYGDEDAAFVVVVDDGAGSVVALGGPGIAVNAALAERSNAAFAAALLAPQPGTRVRVVDPPVPAGGGDQTLLELLGPGLRGAFLQLGMAFVLYALWRAVRLGRPVPEAQPVAVSGSELVAATGRLLGRTRSPGAAASIVRHDLRRALTRRLGLPADATPDLIADVASDRTGIDRARVLAAVADIPVRSEDELVAVARAAAQTRQEVLR